MSGRCLAKTVVFDTETICKHEQLRREVLALLEERSRKQIKIEWQCSLHAARTKLNPHDTHVHPQHEQYKET